MASEYLTIKEFAQRAGVTPQAIHKQLDRKLKDYVITDEKGKKTISAEALELYKGRKTNKPKADAKQAQDDMVEFLKRQLEEKDNQIRALQELIRTEQSLRVSAEHRIALLEQRDTPPQDEGEETIIDGAPEEKPAQETVADPEESADIQQRERKSFWQRFKDLLRG